MKLLIKGEFFFLDNEICLIRALQKKGIKLRYLVPVDKWRLKAALLDIKKQYPHTGIYPASLYEEFNLYAKYINLDDVYVINRPHGLLHPSSIWLYLKILLFVLRFSPDVIHYTWQQYGLNYLFYLFKARKVMTVHDPIPHSNADNERENKARLSAFKASDAFVLLSNNMKTEFSKRYNIDLRRIFITKLGVFDYLKDLPYPTENKDYKYILFFGQIAPYKGLEYLLAAMVEVHKKHPNIKLIVAGGGKMYFDIRPYENLEYLDIRNRFIPMEELVPLLKGAYFSVAPYKDATQSGLLYNSLSLCVPMVTTNVGAFPEMIRNGENGLLVNPCDSGALADAIIRLLDNPDLLESMRTNIKNKWIPSMSWDEIADVFIESYKITK